MTAERLWTILMALVTGGVAGFTTWRVAEVSLRSEMRALSVRLGAIERQSEASLMLGLELAMSRGLRGPAMEAARSALRAPPVPTA